MGLSYLSLEMGSKGKEGKCMRHEGSHFLSLIDNDSGKIRKLIPAL